MPKKPTNAEIRAMAKAQYHDEGTIEIDDNAKISRGTQNPGAYVQASFWYHRSRRAWVWVDFPDKEVGNNTYYQPQLKNSEWGKKLHSFEVYRSKENAQRDFPGRKILEYHGDDIENPTYKD